MQRHEYPSSEVPSSSSYSAESTREGVSVGYKRHGRVDSRGLSQDTQGSRYQSQGEAMILQQQQQQQQQWNAQQLEVQHQAGLGIQGYSDRPDLLQQSPYYGTYPTLLDQQTHHHPDRNSTPYSNNIYYDPQLVSPLMVSHQQPQYQSYPQLQQQQMPTSFSPPSTNRHQQFVKSPRQQFSDTLRRGVQNFAFTPTSTVDNRKNQELRRNSTLLNQSLTLPARPDLAIQAAAAALASQGTDNGNSVINSQPTSSVNYNQTNRSFPAITGPPRPPPSLSLAARFPPLSPMPTLSDDASEDYVEMHKKYQAREEGLLLRVDALGFQPEASWQVMQEATTSKDASTMTGKEREMNAPVLGIRLLQRLDLLQKENEELETIFSKLMHRNDDAELQGEFVNHLYCKEDRLANKTFSL